MNVQPGEVQINLRYSSLPVGFKMPDFDERGFHFASSSEWLTATGKDTGRSVDEVRHDIEEVLKHKSADFIFQHGYVVRFTINDIRSCSEPGKFSMNLGSTIHCNPDTSFGAPMQQSFDRLAIRNRVIHSCLAGGDAAMSQQLFNDVVLLHSIESFVSAVIDRTHQMAELYKAIEVIQQRLGGRHNFVKIGLTKAYVDYVMSRANQFEHDERHAPVSPSAVVAIPDTERAVCVERTRDVIEKYAGAILKGTI